MASPNPPFDPSKPIPSQPITSEQQYDIKSGSGSLIVGEGLNVVASQNKITSDGSGDVFIQTANGISGGPITGAGTLTLTPSGVAPGTYCYSNFEVDIYGRITAQSPAPLATCSDAGAIRIASFFEIQAGTSLDTAVSPAGLTAIKSNSINDISTYGIATPFAVKTAYDKAAEGISKNDFTAKGQVIASTGPGDYTALPAGTDGQVLKVCGLCPGGVFWGTDVAGGGIPTSTLTAPGELIVALAANTAGCIPYGLEGQVLTVRSACSATGGVGWETPPTATPATPTAEGTVYGLTTTTPSCNTALGNNSLNSLTSGTSNVAIGFESSRDNSTGDFNVSVGSGALAQNTSGCYNVALGYGSLFSNTGGLSNTAVGYTSLLFASGGANTALGYSAGCSIGTGQFNTVVGWQAGCGISTGNHNIMIGNHPQVGDVSCNIILGVGGSDIRLRINEKGALSFDGICYGVCNMFLRSNGPLLPPTWVLLPPGSVSPATPTVEGAVYGCSENSGNFNVSLGYQSLQSVGSGVENVAIGTQAGVALTSGQANTVVGALALSSNATGTGNTAIGHAAMQAAPGGFLNVAIGVEALNSTSGDRNTALGEGSLRSLTNQNDNVGVGACSLYSNNASSNTAVGTCSSRLNTTGTCLVSVGFQSLASNTTGCSSTAVGYQALTASTGNFNTALGTCALATVTSGVFNTGVGAEALQGSQGNSNTALGHFAGFNLITGDNNVFIGNVSGTDALCNLVVGSNHVILGNDLTTDIIQKVPATIGSDIRSKKVYGGVPLGLPFVENIETIKYQWCNRETGEVTDDRYRYGFSAQNIIANEENPEHPVIGGIANPDMLTINPTDMIPVLVNAIRELSEEVKALKGQIESVNSGARG